MQKTLESPASATKPAGPYSQVAKLDLGAGSLLILSGQIALDDNGEIVGPGNMKAQAERVFEIIDELLAPYGAGFEDVVNIRTFMTDLDLLPEYAAVRRSLFPGVPPTSTTVEVSRLFREGALLEVDVTAAVG